MRDEQHVRALLQHAAELADLGPAPVERLVAAGRRRRRRNRILTAATAAVAVAAAVTIPAAIRAGSHAGPVTAPRPARPTETAAGLARGHWTHLPDSPLIGRQLGNYLATWTGRELVVAGFGGEANKVEGATYVPGAGWHSIAAIPDGLGNSIQQIFWAGSDLVVLHQAGPGPTSVAAVYAPERNKWSVIAFPLPTSANGPQLAGTSFGDQIVFAEAVAGRVEAYSYSVPARSWHRLSVPLPGSHKITEVTMTTAGRRLILLSTWNNGPPGVGESGSSGVDVRAMTGGSWRTVTGWPQQVPHICAQPAAGGQIFLAPTTTSTIWPRTYLANADTLTVRAVPPGPPAPAESGFPKLRYVPGLWTGAAVIAFAPDYGMNFGPEIFHDNMAALDPASGRWYRLQSGPPDYAMAWPLSPIWGGDRMYVTNGGALWSFGTT